MRFIDWMMEKRILPSSEYEIEWDDLLAASDEEKLKNAKEMTEINEKNFNSGGGAVFEAEEIREAAGYEPEDLPEEGEEIEEEDIDDGEGEIT